MLNFNAMFTIRIYADFIVYVSFDAMTVEDFNFSHLNVLYGQYNDSFCVEI